MNHTNVADLEPDRLEPRRSAILNRIEWQPAVLSPTPSRADLVSLEPSWARQQVRIRVHRNHAFEFVQSATTPFLAYADMQAAWDISDYDDSLAFGSVQESGGDTDAEIVWLDLSRYTMPEEDLAGWLTARLEALRDRSTAPILLVTCGSGQLVGAVSGAVPGLYTIDLDGCGIDADVPLYDEARAGFQGTRLSRQSQLRIAQRLSLAWLPAVLAPRIKAIAIDLDNTLYRGVLGEDGIEGIELTPDHLRLQQTLVEIGRSGVLLAVVSKNEREDVDRMFEQRGDFVLGPDALAGIEVNWQSKGQNIQRLADAFNIAPSAFLMLDDNHGELIAAADSLPGLRLLHASDDAAVTCSHLDVFPGLFTFGTDVTDRLRAADIRANAQRAELGAKAATGDPATYLGMLETTATLRVRPGDELKRLCDIPKKTNQFNLALRRLRDTEVASYLESPERCVVSMALRDKLSDSGNVGAVYATATETAIRIDELCVSCRALGRSVEDEMIGEAIALAAETIGRSGGSVEFVYRKGPRNGPALSWLARVSRQTLDIEIEGDGEDNAPLHVLSIPLSSLPRAGEASSGLTVVRG